MPPEAGGEGAPLFVPAHSASLTAVPAPTHVFAGSSAAWPANYVEPHKTRPGIAFDAGIPRYSNTFVSETEAGKPAGLFVSADYHDWGGYPVYYPYPYTLISEPIAYRPFGIYRNWRRNHDAVAGYRNGSIVAGAPAHSGSGPVSSKGVDVTGGAASGIGAQSGARGTAQTRGSRGGAAAYGSGYRGSGKSSGSGYRGSRRGMSDSYGGSRGRAGAPWRSRPR